MPKFSKASLDRLLTVHEDLQRLFFEVIDHYDCSILEGIRSPERQRELVRTGKSKTLNSKHLKGWAVDVSPAIPLTGRRKVRRGCGTSPASSSALPLVSASWTGSDGGATGTAMR